MVASRIVGVDQRGYVITLEDLGHDDAMRHTVSEQGYVHGAGSMSLAGMLMYLLLLWLKFRYFSGSKQRCA